MEYPSGYYWWHNAILNSLKETGPYNVRGIASNTQSRVMDTARAVDELLAWGMVVECPPAWDTEGALVGKWVTIPADAVSDTAEIAKLRRQYADALARLRASATDREWARARVRQLEQELAERDGI